MDRLADVGHRLQVTSPATVEVPQHDLAAPPDHRVASVCLHQPRTPLGIMRGELLERLLRAEQSAPALGEDLALLGEEPTVPPGVGVDLQHLPLGDPLRVVDGVPPPVALEQSGDPVMGGGDLLGLERRRHHRIVHRREEDRTTRIALTPGPTPQLVVQPLGAVPARAHDVESAERDDLVAPGLVGSAEPDVRPATGHLRGDGDVPDVARLRDDGRLLLVVLGVEDRAPDALLREPGGQRLGLGHVVGADQHRLPGGVDGGDVLDQRAVLAVVVDVGAVGFVDTDVGRVRLDLGHPEGVELAQLRTCGQRGAGHAAHLVISADERLDREAVEDLSRLGDRDALLGLHRGLEPVRPSLEFGHASTGGVDELDPALADDVVDVPAQQEARVQGDVDLDQGRADVVGVVEVLDPEFGFDGLRPVVGEEDVATL